MSETKRTMIKKIQVSGQMRKIMADYFYGLDAAAKDDSQKVAWCTSVGPAELLLSFGFHVYYPENHGAMLGATRMAAPFPARPCGVPASFQSAPRSTML